jgi:transcriptional regulator with XRE-family HTH domain
MTKRGGWPPTGFGARLRALRSAQGLTQGDLAERAKCNRFTVNKLERGLQEPAWPLVLALAKALGVPVGAFARDEDPTAGRNTKHRAGPPPEAKAAGRGRPAPRRKRQEGRSKR